MRGFDKRLADLERATGSPRYYIAYSEPEPRFVLPGGVVVDGDAFAEAVERDRNACVIRVQYGELTHDDA
jgi:hypothetical protein